MSFLLLRWDEIHSNISLQSKRCLQSTIKDRAGEHENAVLQADESITSLLTFSTSSLWVPLKGTKA